MFWRFGFHTQSSIDALLEKDDVTIEELMDEEEILQECKAHNKKLIDFLCKAGVLEALLTYITKEPSPDMAEDVKYKYPMLACEIICCDVMPIYDSLIINEELLEEFWQFLEAPAPLNPLQCSYFVRVFGMLLQHKVPETLGFIQKQPNAIDHIIKHIGTSAMMDLVLKISSCEEVKEGEGAVKWLSDAGLIQKLVNQLDPSLSAEVHSNTAQLLIDILNTSHSFGANKNLFLDRIKSKEICSLIVDLIITRNSQASPSAIYNGLSIFIELIQRSLQEAGDGAFDLSDMLSTVVPILNDLHTILNKPYTPPGELAFTSFPAQKPFGSLRVKIVEFFAALLHTNSKEVAKEYVKLRVFPDYVNLFFEYPLHNFLHTLVHDMIVKTLISDSDFSGELVLSLLRDAKITERLVEASKQNESESEKPSGTRKGYMGHVTLIANELVKFASLPTLSEELKSYFSTETWREYEKSSLAETRERDSKPLGGHKPVNVSINIDEEEGMDSGLNSDISGPDQFARFLCHQMTADIPDKFANDDDDDFDEMETDFDRDAEFDTSLNTAANNPFDKKDDDDEVKHYDNDETISWKTEFPNLSKESS